MAEAGLCLRLLGDLVDLRPASAGPARSTTEPSPALSTTLDAEQAEAHRDWIDNARGLRRLAAELESLALHQAEKIAARTRR